MAILELKAAAGVGGGAQGDTGQAGDTGVGDTGGQGDTGIGDTGIGDTGQQGDSGQSGDTGVGDTGVGDTGQQGDSGIGDTGQQGDTGTGDTGPQGDTGIGQQGDTGTQGDTGAGVQGDTGVGDTGQQGDSGVGDTGQAGDTGAGDTGEVGDTGVGDTGVQGDTGGGDTGIQGDTGVGDTGVGDTGVGDTGQQGDTGQAGDTGVGDTGSEGDTGTAPTGQIWLSAAGGWPSTTNGCAPAVQVEFGTNNVDHYFMDFDKDANEYAQWSLAMPSDWDAGTFTAQYHWTFASPGAPAETVDWGGQGIASGDDDPLDTAWGGAVLVTDTAIAIGDRHISVASAAITFAGTPAAGEGLQFRCYRNVATDDLGSDARLIGVMLTFTRS